MARIDPLPPGEWPEEMRAALAALRPPEPLHPPPKRDNRPAARNTLGIFAHHPALARAFFTFNGHILMATTLSERQRELIVMRVAALRRSNYEWAQHLFMARDAGLSDEEIGRIAYGPDAPFWDALDAALLRAVDELITDGAITAPTWATLAAELDVRQLLDVVFTVNAYDGLARMFRSFDLAIDADIEELMRRHAAGKDG
ncbi:carboxymuconolactone decarboxylase family protein [Nocardia asteroides]|uniref:carboxymuconolactone decarboxylase family protein n=1 Tax=Nocardia asteroides TaxID=1824 RepID=UPI001E40B2F9|nr:carboxymuconolactone decarboxylase family protein [Nocardia asteroides]UGT62010.1 carboxymuconolactone decarboxylase family protein [Nocardia asteroides]